VIRQYGFSKWISVVDKKQKSEIVISFIDVTERKLMEIELLKSKEQSESATKLKLIFLLI
jgi:hypothetical protein